MTVIHVKPKATTTSMAMAKPIPPAATAPVWAAPARNTPAWCGMRCGLQHGPGHWVRRGLAALTALAGLWLALAAVLLAPAAGAQTNPVIRTFTVQPVAELVPGTELQFKVNGSSGAAVTLTLQGSTQTVVLAESSPGNYQGSYTLSVRDQVVAGSEVRARLRLGAREVSAALAQPLLLAPVAIPAASTTSTTTAAATTTGVTTAMAPPVIDTFASSSPASLTGGNEIGYSVRGTPGAIATVSLTGTDAIVTLSEARPGEYTGTYTIRTRDAITTASMAKVTLSMGTLSTSAEKSLATPLIQPTRTAAARASCDNCGVVEAIKVTEVAGEPGYTGAIAGGVAGALLGGSMVKKGQGKTAAQVLGAVGGAYAGREVEKALGKDKRYDVTVRMANGTVQTLAHSKDPGVAVGASVKVINGLVVPAN